MFGRHDVILPRHLTEAAQALKRPAIGTITSPAAIIPIHYDYLCTELSKISDLISEDEKLSAQPPRVLVIGGEVSGVVSSMFRLAGAQVATCDLLPSEIDYVPHFQGDCKHIQDQGWDFVIGHPPCTYHVSFRRRCGLAQDGARKGAGGTLRG